ncbi:hypothetical protein J4H86_12065 [Spiractinospora alimapuensis]|uniref:hypothetical protein n=1 Tax=Spiractinospora alimapuensis TaxID=2820884 RepID=UPI001F39EFCB|nr:hypothetical protein [Spiractinospora alimapuensis]QVQ54345.1 hypothetical protein J4H86_12065 [Spiractinospora alimapuensis]
MTAEAEPGALLDLVLAPGNDPWTEEIVRAVAEVARRAGVEVGVSTASGAIEDVDRWTRSMRARGTRGVILVNSASAHTIQDGVTRDGGLDVPLVVVDPSGGTAAMSRWWVPPIGWGRWPL